MNKIIRYVLLSFLTIMPTVSNATLKTVTFDYDNDYKMIFPTITGVSSSDSNAGDFTDITYSAEIDGVMLIVSPEEGAKVPNRIWSASPRLRMYAGYFAVKATGGDVIKKIEFNAPSKFDLIEYSDAPTAIVDKVWKPEGAGSMGCIFTINSNTQLKSIVVTLGAAQDVLEDEDSESEAITHTLSITASGNGTVIYDVKKVRGGSSTFSVTEGTSATITFTPDAGYCIASVKVNDTDVTSSVADNKYTISNITANTTLEVEFVEVITDLAYDGVSYKVVSYDDKTVNVASGNYGLTLTVPATFEAKDKTWTVTGIDSDALTNATELAAVIWEPEVLFNNEVSNPNLLLYVKDAKFAPSYIQNVVVGDQAENIVLKDAASGNSFYCPKAFTAKRISYEHHYNMTTGYNTCQGWETIALPFDVTTVLNQKGVDLVPYASWQQGSSQRPFWLYQMTNYGWQAATAIQSNTPYIISMPNNVVYQPSYIQTGYIQFLGSNVEVKASSQLNESQYGKRHFYVSYQQQSEISDIYALNVNNQWSSNTDVSQAVGSAFIRNSRTIHPFEAYMTIEGSNAPWMIPVFDNNMPTNIVEMERMRNVGNEDWYDLQGRKLQGVPKQDGIYIRNGKKIKK